jgi:hypothetical protein
MAARRALGVLPKLDLAGVAQRTIDHLDAVAGAKAVQVLQVEGAVLAVVQAHPDFVAGGGAHAPFNLVADYGAADGAGHRGQILAIAATHPVS